jgi:hypothetical protein
MMTRLASLTFAEMFTREIEKSGKTNGQVMRETGIQDTLIGMYLNGHREPSLKNTRRLCTVFPALLDWIAAAPKLDDVPEAVKPRATQRPTKKPTKKSAQEKRSRTATAS